MRRRLSHGMTLVETLVVLAIAGLIIAVLIAVLLPSDDRRCRLEAERLAAFLTSASAESVMRDAPVRVVFDLNKGVARREFARVGASITDALWEEDEKTEPFEVSDPVRLTDVDTAESPETTSGDAFMIFRGERTEGAVVILGVEQIFYSVVVPPNGAEIKVEKGRSGRPGGGSPISRDLPALVTTAPAPLSDTLPGAGLGGAASNRANFGGSARSPSKRKTPSKTKTKTPTPKVNDPVSPASSGSVNPGTPAAVAKPPVVDPPKPAEPTTDKEPATPLPPNAPPGTLGVACVNDDQCSRWAQCNVDLGFCSVSPVGRALRMTAPPVSSPMVIQPAGTQITSTVDSILRQLINTGGLYLVVYFDSDRPWLVQGQRANEVIVPGLEDPLLAYRQVTNFPSFPGAELTGDGYTCDAETFQCTLPETGLGDGEIRIYLPNGSEAAGACRYDPLTLRAKISAQFTLLEDLSTIVSEAPGLEGQSNNIRVTAELTRSAARQLSFGGQTLLELLETDVPFETAPDEAVVDTDGDGLPDAWNFIFEGPAKEVELLDTPYSDPNATPENCN